MTMNNIQQLQEKISSLELRCLNHSDGDVRHQWAIIADGYMTNGRALWREIDDEKTLNEAIAKAEQLLGSTK